MHAPISTNHAPVLDLDIRRKWVGRGAARRLVLDGVRLQVAAGEIVALVGPSGCGKTTLLRIAGGLDMRFEGTIRWAGGTNAGIGTVFQEPRLLPWRTVRENLVLVRPPDPAEADALLRTLGIPELAGAYPPALSGGQARRVAIARAFAIRPSLVLLDEPFVSLDAATAAASREVLLAAWRERRCAAVLVTHDMAEAEALADRVVTLSSGPARVVGETAVSSPRRYFRVSR